VRDEVKLSGSIIAVDWVDGGLVIGINIWKKERESIKGFLHSTYDRKSNARLIFKDEMDSLVPHRLSPQGGSNAEQKGIAG
jgi:hypothetical protein